MNTDGHRFGKTSSALSVFICVHLWFASFPCVCAAEPNYERLIEGDLQRFRPVDARGAEELRETLGPAFRIYHDAHFTLLSDTDESTARAIVEATEAVYRAFYTDLPTIGLRPIPPERRLMCILFVKRAAFREYLRKTDGAPAEWSTGLYSWRTNRCVLYHDLDNPAFDEIRRESGAEAAARLRAVALVTTLQKARHEVAHQLMYNSGLFSRGREYPFWLEEGLAMLFELTDDRGACWPSVTNEFRMKTYRAAEKGGRLVSLRKLIGMMGEPEALRGRDTGKMPVPPLTRPAQPQAAEAIAEAYAQAWGLTYFAWNKHPAELKAFVEGLRGDESDKESTEAFVRCFGDLDALTKRCREYLGSL